MNRQHVADLFEQAVELPASERSGWIATACAGDEVLRAELERLLHADAQAARFMEKPPALIAQAFAQLADAQPSTAPRQFGAYRVLRQIGVGGMGEVWLAERSDGEFEQRVAIKQLAYPTPGLLQRFRQERQILARLEHANIARLIDGGVDAANAPYLVMEYVDGVPITVYAREHALDLRRRLDLFVCVCEGVQYAHQNLVVHRDLKPSNIFVTADGTPKLLDFGIAKVLATTDEAAPTQTAARLLTPDYAAPEQFNGGAITTATDVYALGVVLYELLTDARPPRSTAAGDASAGTEPPPPSTVIDRSGGTARRRALRGDIDRIVLTALAHEPRRRYPSAEALAADIRRYLSGRPVLARGDSAGYRFRKFARRNRYALAAAVVAFGACLAAAIVSLHQAQLARAQAVRAEQQTAQAEAGRTFLVGVFEHADPDENKGQSITAQQLLERGEQQLRAIDDSQPAIRADLTTLISGLYWDIGDSEHAAKLLPLLQAAATDPRVPDLIRARALSGLARAEIDQRLFDQAIPHAELALALAGSAGKSGAREASEASHHLAHALSELNDPRAEALLRQVIAGDLVAHGERSDEVADDLLLLGFTLDALLRADEAVATLQRQVALARDLHGDLHSSVVNGLNGLAGALMRKGDWEAAETTYRQSLDAERRLLGPEHVSTQIIHSNLLALMERRGNFADALPERLQMLRKGNNVPDAMRDHSVALVTHLIGVDYRELGQLDKAQASARDALAIWRRTQGSDDAIDSAPPLENLGVVLYLQGRYVEAEDALQHAIAIMRKRASPTSQWLARMRGELADSWRRQRRYPDALREASEAMAVLAPALKASHEANPVAGVLQAQVSEAQLDSSDAASADKSADEALTLSRHALPKGNYRLGIALFASARAKLALGRPGEAESLLREALAVRSPPHPADDPRVLEVKVALINALDAQGKRDEARGLTAEVEPRLQASTSPYATELLARLARH